jgi:hypothetical protein
VTADPRNLATVQHGAPLRDAAVNPKPVDYLPPINAGEAGELGNPHGPTVVAPGIHAEQGVRPVRHGVVSSNVDTQEADEVAAAKVWQPQTTPPAPEPDPEPDTGTGA